MHEDLDIHNRKIQFKNMLDFFNEEKKKERTLYLGASKKRGMFSSFIFTNCYKNKSKVAFVGDEFPQEFLLPFNIYSMNLQTTAGVFSQSSKLNNIFMKSNKQYLSKDLCSNIRGGFGSAFANCIPKPNIVIANTSPCNSSTKMISYMSKYYEVPYYLLDTPKNNDESSVEYMTNQFKEMIAKIEDEFNVKFDEDRFLEVVRYSNEAKTYYLKTRELCMNNRLPLIQKELYELIVSNLWGYKELVDICKELYEEALELVKSVDKTKKKRIMWYGQVPTYINELMKYIESKVDLIYFTSLNKCHDSLIDESNPMKSMAERQINYTWDPFIKGENIVDICNKYEIDGVILQNSWGCRNLNSTNKIIRDYITASKIKSVIIDSDFVDCEKFSYNQVKNRIDAFIELLI